MISAWKSLALSWKSLTISMAGALSVAAFISADPTDMYTAAPAAIDAEPLAQAVGIESIARENKLVDCAVRTDAMTWSNDYCPSDHQAAAIDNVVLVAAEAVGHSD